MLDFGFSEILLTSAIALVVLGPEKLPKVARQVGNWMGRARVMARQLTEQLDREITAEELLRQAQKPAARSVPITPAAAPSTPPAPNAAVSAPEAAAPPAATTPAPATSPAAAVGPGDLASAEAARSYSDALRDTATPASRYPTPLAATAAAGTGSSETHAAAAAPTVAPPASADSIKPANE
jgi:sec-independent protein translocase protein TatB